MSQATYNRLGHYDYGLKEEDIGEIKKWKGKCDGLDTVYFGEMKSGTDRFENFGILVYANGATIKLT